MAVLDRSRRRKLVAGICLMPALNGLAESQQAGEEKKVGAVEDLMREHGVLRRALLVYIESASELMRNPGAFDVSALNQTAQLFRSFGEDYHEKKLEEAYIFPVVRKVPGPAAAMVDILIAQHQRGREITDFIASTTRSGKVEPAKLEQLARALSVFVLMYQNHAAREDTVLFPAWKTALSRQQLDELSEKFEQIEQQQFGRDGFEDAVAQIDDIERRLGLADLGQFTPPPPPKS